MIRTSLLAAASLVLIVAAAPSFAAPSKGAQVPAFTLNLLQNRFGDQTYAPTRVPSGYRYSRWQKVNDSLVLTFKERTSTDSLRFEVSKLAPAAPCDGGGAFHRIIQTDDNKIYYDGDKGYWKAWRCVVSPTTRTRYALTVLSNGKLLGHRARTGLGFRQALRQAIDVSVSESPEKPEQVLGSSAGRSPVFGTVT